MKKFLIIIPVALIFYIVLFNPYKASASTAQYIYEHYTTVIYLDNRPESQFLIYSGSNSETTPFYMDNGYLTWDYPSSSVKANFSVGVFGGGYDLMSHPEASELAGYSTSNFFCYGKQPVGLQGYYSFSEPEPENKWWDYIKDWWFYDYGLSELIDWLFGGDDEENNFPDTEILTSSPTPSPTPTPTVRVVTISTPGPNNTTITNTYYEYTDPSTNQPTISPDRPPWYHGDGCNCNDCSGGNNGGGGDKDPEDYEPIALNFGVPSATPYVLESENPLLYDYGDNITEYKDGIETVSQLTTVFPEKWYVIIGIIITFPLIAGFIAKLLK